ncbi:hypothetical protein DK419_18060 [Methylobacterium terrae]|uniref:Flagellar protein FlaG n=1 Tax=Methylobacterium terrae TaxID=2202827 RepID=A0A2U8WPG1_9HYPH|nr:hypothetical protein [Methylobacterium terrae]AWN47997.1 hypothetical protein DK419_18060 [Methylobacterium terrae]
MIETSSLAAALPPAAVAAATRNDVRPSSRTGPDIPLDPAVTLDLSREAEATAIRTVPPQEATVSTARYRRDPDSRQIVFQVVDPKGEVIEQLPSEAILRARTYAREAEARAAEIGTAVARSA